MGGDVVVDDPREALKRYMAKHGLKYSRQREVITDVFFRADGHLRVDELLDRAREVDPRISQATVYRTMRLLTDSGLAEQRQFIDGQTRYEPSDQAGEHHDHLMCTECGKIIEFVDERIEELQEHVARQNGFVVTDHKMELYGICSECQQRGNRSEQ